MEDKLKACNYLCDLGERLERDFASPFTLLATSKNNTTQEQANDINSQLLSLASEMATLRTIIETKPKDFTTVDNNFAIISNQLDKIQDSLKSLQISDEDSQMLVNYLLQSTTDITTNRFETDDAIVALHKEYVALKNAPVPNLVAIAAKQQQLIDKKAEVQAEREIFDAQLENIHDAFKISSIIASFAGKPKLARQINVIGQASVNIGKHIGGLLGVGTAAAASGPLAPIVGISGAVLSIVNLISENEPIEAVMLNAINELSRQVGHLESRMEIGFMQTNEMLVEFQNKTSIQFNEVKSFLENLFTTVVNEFAKVYREQIDIKDLLSNVRNDINNLNQRISDLFISLSKQSYHDRKEVALSFHRLFSYPENVMSPTDITQYYSEFKEMAITHAKNAIMSRSDSNIEDETLLVSELNLEQEADIAFKINMLTRYAVNILGLKNTSSIVNPVIWADAATTFAEFIYKTPEFVITDTCTNDMDKIIKAGEDFRQFILELKTSQAAFEVLHKKYYGTVENIIELCKAIETEILGAAESFLKEVNKLDFAFKTMKNHLTIYLNALKSPGTPISEATRHKYNLNALNSAKEFADKILDYINVIAEQLTQTTISSSTSSSKQQQFCTETQRQTLHTNIIKIKTQIIKFQEKLTALTDNFSRPAFDENALLLSNLDAEVELLRIAVNKTFPLADISATSEELEVYLKTILPTEMQQIVLRKIIDEIQIDGTPLSTTIFKFESISRLFKIFISLAFQNDYHCDDNLKYCINRGLLDKKRLIKVIQSGLSSNKNITNIITEHFEKTYKEFWAYLKTKISFASTQKKNGIKECGYSLIDNLLQTLANYKKFMLSPKNKLDQEHEKTLTEIIYDAGQWIWRHPWKTAAGVGVVLSAYTAKKMTEDDKKGKAKLGQ